MRQLPRPFPPLAQLAPPEGTSICFRYGTVHNPCTSPRLAIERQRKMNHLLLFLTAYIIQQWISS